MKYDPKDRCQEDATFQSEKIKLVRDANGAPVGLLKNVKVLGLTGKLGKREYRPAAVKKAIPLYDGVAVNLNHAKGEGSDLTPANVDVRSRLGKIVEPRYRADGVYADLKYNPKHAYASTLEWFAENEPGLIGLSHDAILQGPFDDTGKRIVEAIPKVYSVDLVADPGSTRGLHEDASEEDEDLADLDLDDAQEDDDTPENHFANGVAAIVKDMSLSAEEKLERIKAALKAIHAGDDKPKKKMSKEVESAAEIATLKEQNAKLEAELATFRANEAANQAKLDLIDAKEACKDIPERFVTDVFLKNLVARGRESWSELIADQKALASLKNDTPKSSGRDQTRSTEDNLDAFVKEVNK